MLVPCSRITAVLPAVTVKRNVSPEEIVAGGIDLASTASRGRGHLVHMDVLQAEYRHEIVAAARKVARAGRVVRPASSTQEAALLTTAASASVPNPPVPNIVVVIADDLGYGDLGCYGDLLIRTPHLDRFAAEGLRLTSYYAPAANCSPSRTGLLTGRIPTRAGITDWIPQLSPTNGLRRLGRTERVAEEGGGGIPGGCGGREVHSHAAQRLRRSGS